ncbi:MAG TPA: GldG family protein [Myxococcota bacterium]|nr:GldG family protein [Myxococcota bacterium]
MDALYGVVGAVLLAFGLIGLFAAAAPAIVGLHLVLGGGLLALAGLRSFRRVAEAMGTSNARIGANSLVQALVALVICGLLGYLTVRHPVHWDWTEAKEHTLAQGSLDTIAAIPKDGQLDLYAFFPRGAEGPAKTLLEQYQYAGQKADRKVTLNWFSPTEHPDLAQRFQVASTSGMVVVCSGPCDTAKGTVKVTDFTEQALTRAVRQVLSSKKKIYFLQGHGEADPEDRKGPGAAGVKGGLEDENATVESLVLTGAKDIPADADAVIVAGPDHALSDGELAILDAYLKRGGALLVALDPAVETHLEGQLKAWGIDAGPEVVVEQQLQLFAGPSIGVQIVVQKYGAHAITEKLNAQTPTMFRLARPVRRAEGSEANVTELALTSPESWAESDVKDLLASKPVSLDPTKDRAGPLALAVAREFAPSDGAKRGGRLIVVGDSDWLRNRYVTEVFNADLFLNMTGWLTGSEQFATIDRKRPRAATVNLTLEQFANFRFLALFALPELILLLGVLNWWRRRA